MHVVTRLRGFGASIVKSPAVKIYRPTDATSSSASIYAGQYDRSAGRDVLSPPTPTIVRQPAPPPVSQPTLQPTGVPADVCDTLYAQLMAAAPVHIQACLNAKPYHRGDFDDLCRSIARGQTTLQSGAAQWANYVAQQCPPPSTSTPASPPPPPTGQPTIPPPADIPTTFTPSDPGGGPSDAPSTEADTRLRQLGSVVGIGLLVAVGLTYARKKGMLKLTKRRRRR